MRTIDHPKTVVASSQQEIVTDQTVPIDLLLQKYPAQSRKEIALDHNEGQIEKIGKTFVTRLPLRRKVGADELVQCIPGMGILCDPRPAPLHRNGFAKNCVSTQEVALWTL